MVIDRSPHGVWYDWHCLKCGLESSWDSEAEALAWASQPVPFLPEIRPEKLCDTEYKRTIREGQEALIDKITAALAVREEKQ